MNLSTIRHPSVRRLLRCGRWAALLYITAGLLQVLFRDGFDVARHPISILANGRFGWVQTGNFLCAGLLMMAFAAGCLRVRKAWKGGLTAGLTLGLYGLGMIGAGIFGAGPMADFPPATDRTAGILPANDLLHFAFGGTGFLGLIAGALILGIRFIRAGRWGRAGFSILTGLFFAYAFMGIASGPPTSAAMIAFYVAVLLGWGWIASLSNWMLGDLRDGAHARSIA